MSFRLRGGQPFQKRKSQSSGKSCGKSIKVARVRITEAGGRALQTPQEAACALDDVLSLAHRLSAPFSNIKADWHPRAKALGLEIPPPLVARWGWKSSARLPTPPEAGL